MKMKKGNFGFWLFFQKNLPKKINILELNSKKKFLL